MTQEFAITPEGPGPCSATRTEPTVSEGRRIRLAAIKINPAIQQRVNGTSQEVVREYAQAMRGGARFPPLVVFHDGTHYHLADGFHRAAAHRSARSGEEDIECEVHPGGHDEALLFACAANASHGRRRSNADKRKAVLALLRSEVWWKWSDRQIGHQCGVSHGFVAKLRAHLETFPDAGGIKGGQAAGTPGAPSAIDDIVVASDRKRKVQRRGKSYDMNTAAIGSSRKEPKNTPSRAPFTSHAWALLTRAEKVKCANGIGAREFFEALKEATPGFDILETAFKLAGPPERQSFFSKHYEEFKTYAPASGYETS
jgi:hypothetical protein